MAAVKLLWAPRAWVAGRWRDAVLLAAGDDGRWAEVSCDTPPPPAAERLAGDVLPALVDAHSHAFQRAFVGMAERRDSAHDDFWSWRDRMYGVALKLRPEQLRAVAAQLYAELLAGGYSQVCEFHYLHHDLDGRPYADPAAMSRALADAAEDAGIGLTLLPVLYERAGFQAEALRADQRRFATTPQQVLEIASALRGRAGVTVGAAVHSLRAARPASIAELAAACTGPLHVHVAEQTAEVEDCLVATGCRPIEWLARHAGLDARWQLVHATHATPAEIEAVAAAGAGVVICPATEADLGDGFCDLPRWLDAGVPLAVGSDSQVVRAWPEELRWLEWGQRLLHRRRNVAAAPGAEPASAARLFERMRAGGGTAAGFERWGLEVGARADLVELDAAEPALAGLPPSHRLDGLVFGAPAAPFRRTLVGGRWVEPDRGAIKARFLAAMQELWEEA
ncbi:formimidoylglutamate deiminase [Rubrivivax gelatinosus]|uniref:Formimidoylglutamate deiminase n=1 Tax=Rubrivivax gelatinosus TaxID=28068 RepID=A0ABS1E0U9_RUBGE|nr:formimidoylglutamate deiminase [Rubrivivax gelatinosus]MBK1715070.1 formimidoylglutamate deiminase [Rubrivivax gelatinosus]